MSFIGMDVRAVRQISSGLGVQANHVASITSTVEGLVGQSMQLWQGPDAVDFAHVWHSSHRPMLEQLRQTLEEMATAAQVNADQQEVASSEGGPWAGRSGVGASGSSASGAGSGSGGIRGLLAPLWPADLVGTVIDIVETGTGWKLEDLPSGGFLGAVVKGLGLGSAGAEFIDSLQHRDWGGAGAATVDGVATFVPAPISLLWTGLSAEAFFFIPRDYTEQDQHLAWMQSERGMAPAEITERYTGLQGFIDLGNDNAARKAPWLVEGADRLMEKPAEWLYNMGIEL